MFSTENRAERAGAAAEESMIGGGVLLGEADEVLMVRVDV